MSEDSIARHYDERYFASESSDGEFAAAAQLFLFRDYIAPADRLIDFGCGGGFLLEAVRCEEKIGVEINPVAREFAHKRGIATVSDLAEIADAWADVIMSNHALEHVPEPFNTAKTVLRKLKPGGRAIFMVPCERYDVRYVEENRDQHLYTWSPLNLGNLFRHAGFVIESCERVAHRFPPKPTLVHRLVGWRLFHMICRGYAFLSPRLTQVRVVARKPHAIARSLAD